MNIKSANLKNKYKYSTSPKNSMGAKNIWKF